MDKTKVTYPDGGISIDGNITITTTDEHGGTSITNIGNGIHAGRSINMNGFYNISKIEKDEYKSSGG